MEEDKREKNSNEAIEFFEAADFCLKTLSTSKDFKKI